MAASVWGNEQTEFFNSLTPDKILNSLESLGFKTTGRVIPLASMENRVMEVEIENDQAKHVSENFLIAKFYRPGRWSPEQIQDEHDFLFDLLEHELHVIAPIKVENKSLFTNEDGLSFCLFPKQGGRACDEWTDDLLEQMGRLLARLHNVGAARKATHRLELTVKKFGWDNLELLKNSRYLPLEYKNSYVSLCEQIFNLSEKHYAGINLQRIHGDCHHGNILLHDGRPFMIDFDDMSMGPKMQDIWMCIPGRDPYSNEQRQRLIAAYDEMSFLDPREYKLSEILRALRIVHFSAWISLRFEDQAFQRAFFNFGQVQYWEQEMAQLREQLALIQDYDLY